MNVKMANRLLEYRKKSGLSQEELAEKLNISRQSVSKWERAEASPDTDNLIQLSKIYGVSIDDLINVDKDINYESNHNKQYKIIVEENDDLVDEHENELIIKEEYIEVKLKDSDVKFQVCWDKVYTKNNDNVKTPIIDKKSLNNKYNPSLKQKKVLEAINGSLILIIAALYIFMCSINIQQWGKFWIVFILYPCIVTLFESIFYKDASKFAFPVFVSFVYFFLGMYYKLWHPYWILFCLIPIYYLIVDAFKRKQTLYYEDEYGNEHSFLINKGDIKVIFIRKDDK